MARKRSPVTVTDQCGLCEELRDVAQQFRMGTGQAAGARTVQVSQKLASIIAGLCEMAAGYMEREEALLIEGTGPKEPCGIMATSSNRRRE